MEASGIDLVAPHGVRLSRRSLRAICACYVAAIAVAEATVAFVDVAAGLALHAAVLFALVAIGLVASSAEAPKGGDRSTDALGLCIGLALVPLARILSLTVPFPELPSIWWYAAGGIPLLVAVALTARLHGADWTRETFSLRWSRAQALIAASGLPLGLDAYIALRPDPLERHPSAAFVAVGIVVLPVFAGLVEELLFRGILQRLLVDLFGGWGVVATAALFTSMYLGTRSAPYVALIALVGVLFGWCVYATKSLAGVVLAHGLASVGLVLVWPYVLG